MSYKLTTSAGNVECESSSQMAELIWALERAGKVTEQMIASQIDGLKVKKGRGGRPKGVKNRPKANGLEAKPIRGSLSKAAKNMRDGLDRLCMGPCGLNRPINQFRKVGAGYTHVCNVCMAQKGVEA